MIETKAMANSALDEGQYWFTYRLNLLNIV